MKKVLTIVLVIAMLAVNLIGCAKTEPSKTEAETTKATTNDTGETSVDRPDTWIADRTIVVQAYVDDIGYAIPRDINETAVMKEFTKRTGIKLNIQYTPGDSDEAVMASQMASGSIPDVIITYLNDSTRPEFGILQKAADEGMFADVSSYMKDSEVYSRYYEDGYLPNDAVKNITFRSGLDGPAYLLQLAIDSEDRSLEYNPQDEYLGGMYIQTSIADALGIDPTTINTQDQLYDLLVAIKAGGFTDENGNEVYPLGPKYWGGSVDSLEFVLRELDWGVSDAYNITKDGEIKHEVDTDYVYEKINYVRRLLAEGLMNPEYFTMDSTRAEEVSRTGNSAIMADVHNYVEVVYESDDWIPLGPIKDFAGDLAKATSGKSGYGAWAISADAENPEEIFAFFDYLSTTEGKLLAQYGVEGEHYTMVDGIPVMAEEALQKLNEGDEEYLIHTVGAGFGGSGNYIFDYMLTNLNEVEEFGEVRPGSGSSVTYERSVEIATLYPRSAKLVQGLDATAYLSAEPLQEVKAQMSLLNYNEMLVQAMYATNDEQVKNIVESFSAQMKAAGNDEFIAYIEKIYNEDKNAINFIQE